MCFCENRRKKDKSETINFIEYRQMLLDKLEELCDEQQTQMNKIWPGLNKLMTMQELNDIKSTINSPPHKKQKLNND